MWVRVWKGELVRGEREVRGTKDAQDRLHEVFDCRSFCLHKNSMSSLDISIQKIK